MKIVSASEMAEIDRLSIEEYGYPGIVLMENAGIRIFDRFLASGRNRDLHLLFLVGGGNNGGDALVMARQALAAGFRNITIVLASDKPGDAVRTHVRICEGLHIPVRRWTAGGDIEQADVIFDGLIGTGLQGPLRGASVGLVEAVNSCRAETVAVDIPSGVGDSFEEGFPSIKADRTFTVGLPKLALYLPAARTRCGVIEVVDIGFPRILTTSDDLRGDFLSCSDLPEILPPAAPEAYKKTRGSLCVFAGSPGTLGAAFLAAETASRTRAGLVTLMLEKDLYTPAAGSFRSVMGRPWGPADSPEQVDFTGFSALCVGPGWGFDRRRAWLEACIASGVPGVLDADGLSLLAAMEVKPDLGGRWVLTPHPGECARISEKPVQEILRRPREAVLQAAEAYNAVVVLKAHVTWIGEPSGRFCVIDGMNPAMGTGGSGDVLAGLTAGLLAEGLSPSRAARAAVLVHAEAGRRCYSDAGWFAAEDLRHYIPKVLADAGGAENVR